MDVAYRGCICLAAYRPRRDLLLRQIDSIRAQTERDWLCLIGIDGSDPQARRDINDAIAGDDRFVVREYSNNVGFYRNFERLLYEVPPGTQWVALSDQDDDWFPEKLSTLVPKLEHVSLALGQVMVAPHDRLAGRYITKRRTVSLTAQFIDNQVTGSACVFRRQLLDLALPFPEATELAFHDHWLGVCALADDGVVVAHSPVQDYVQHLGNVIGEERAAGALTRLRHLRTRAGKGVGASLRYLRDQRWRWRVNMARHLVNAGPRLAAADERAVAAVARGRLSLSLTWLVLSAVCKLDAPPARSVALLIGASIFPGASRSEVGPKRS